MDRPTRRFLEDLLRTPGPSGHEEVVQEVWRAYLRSHGAVIEGDLHGNRWTTVRGRGKRSILVAAHADEIGLIVQYIDEDGLIFVRPIGGVDVAVLPSERVTILGREGHVRGVIGRRPHHLREKDGEERLRIEELPIDVGAAGRAEAEERVAVGDPAVFGGDMEPLGGQFATARNFDDRIGGFVVAELARKLSASKAKPGFAIHLASTVQEESGLLGAGNVAEKLRPDAAVVVDVTHDTHQPGIRAQKHGDVRCGRGPALTRGVRSSRVLFEALREAARNAKIPFQVEIDQGHTHTDADAISSRLEGVPVAVVSVPCRYMHTSCEVVHLGDAEATVELLVAFLKGLDPEMKLGSA